MKCLNNRKSSLIGLIGTVYISNRLFELLKHLIGCVKKLRLGERCKFLYKFLGVELLSMSGYELYCEPVEG
uniref:Uncharacterized protein n=1 Tax=Rhizophora mucronata TaxID=61149 RepID=A0A2P2QDG9_RHIMU